MWSLTTSSRTLSDFGSSPGTGHPDLLSTLTKRYRTKMPDRQSVSARGGLEWLDYSLFLELLLQGGHFEKNLAASIAPMFSVAADPQHQKNQTK